MLINSDNVQNIVRRGIFASHTAFLQVVEEREKKREKDPTIRSGHFFTERLASETSIPKLYLRRLILKVRNKENATTVLGAHTKILYFNFFIANFFKSSL